MQIAAALDLPTGVANLISGRKEELVPHLARHMDIQAVADAGGQVRGGEDLGELEGRKRVFLGEENDGRVGGNESGREVRSLAEG